MKIRMASALTKPVIDRARYEAHQRSRASATRRKSAGRRSAPSRRAGTAGRASLTSVTITSAIAPVAAEIMPGRPPAKAMTSGDAERGVEADFGVDARNDRERNRFRDQGQRNDQAREQIVANIRQPVVAERVHGDDRFRGRHRRRVPADWRCANAGAIGRPATLARRRDGEVRRHDRRRRSPASVAAAESGARFGTNGGPAATYENIAATERRMIPQAGFGPVSMVAANEGRRATSRRVIRRHSDPEALRAKTATVRAPGSGRPLRTDGP